MKKHLRAFFGIFIVVNLGCSGDNNERARDGGFSNIYVDALSGNGGFSGRTAGGTGGERGRSCELVSTTCDCGETRGMAKINPCTDAIVEECVCPTTKECVNIVGCRGTQQCDFQGCGECSCEKEIAVGTGNARRIATSLDGDLYILLNESPWIDRIDKQGNLTSLNMRGDFLWVEDFVIDGKGNIVLAGKLLAESGNAVQIQRLSPNGELLGATQWHISPYNSSSKDTYLVGLGVLSNGSVVASATLSYFVGHAFITDQTTVGSDVVLDMSAVNQWHVFDGRYGARQIIGPNDEILLSGSAGDDKTWIAQFSSTGEYMAENIGNDDSVTLITVANNGIVYGGHTYRGIGMVGIGFVPISRLGVGLIADWEENLTDDVYDTTLFDLHGLDDSVLVLLQRNKTNYLARINDRGASIFIDYTNGSPSETELLTPLSYTPIDSILRNKNELVILSKTESGYRVSSMAFSVTETGAQSGESCYSDTDCEKGGCCLRSRRASDLLSLVSGKKGGNGICADPKICAEGNLCATDAECLSGFCLMPSNATVGICSSKCITSSDCNSDAYCAPIQCTESNCPNVCLIDCSSGGTFACQEKYDHWTCQDTQNTEGITVHLCR
jgi:hypothetical protein